MTRTPRPTHGDGHTPTSGLALARCPRGHELIITCTKGCEDAAEGASGFVDPIARTRAPRVEEKPARHRGAKAERPKHFCARCECELPKSMGRPRKVCDACETPVERNARALKQEWNKRHRRAA